MVGDTKAIIEQIKEIIVEYACNPDDYDLTKTAVEIYEISQPHYNEPMFHHQQTILARSDKIGGLKCASS